MSTTEVDSASTTPVEAPAGEPAGSRPAWLRLDWWSRQRALWILAPAVLFLAVRELGLLVLEWMASRNRTSVGYALTSWDSQWYLEIAARGYDGVRPELVDAFGRRTAETPLAFFPGYPLLVRWVAELPGVGLVSAAFAVSVVSGVTAAYGLVRLGERIGGSRRVGLYLVVFFAASPMAVVLSMAYSEALFCALAVWALVGVLERRWLLAGVCCAAAGLVRPTAGALVVAVGLAALVAVIRRRDGWRPWVAGVLAPLGILGYLGWVALRTGHLFGWFVLQQRGWDSRFDGGAATWRFGLDALASARSVLEVATVGIVLGAIILLVSGAWLRLPWPVLVFSLGVLVMDLGSNGLMNSKARLLVPAFTLLLPAAIGLAKRRPATAVTVLVGVAVASAWFGAYSVTSWGYAI
ncbi:membrane protein [Longimycelium tulufanense]|uniref:Membrane protein n=1 Tax=Longimycelium tulufanense TaxID=907463 RepID=A0A8J3CJQ9_9PSEU|nr:glycosyltransferase family 39 protein [Longimycelium tulufanense]GGM77621.1 membrane protein [Longimycelium tulufanense]